MRLLSFSKGWSLGYVLTLAALSLESGVLPIAAPCFVRAVAGSCLFPPTLCHAPLLSSWGECLAQWSVM